MEELKNILNNIHLEKSSEEVINFYGGNKVSIQLFNLYKYLRLMKNFNPEILILGEQPHLAREARTGIPFTSEHAILKMNDRHGVLDKDVYKLIGIRKDNFSNLLWGQVNKMNTPPLMWNLFPFLPHQENKPTVHRHPSVQEMQWGKELLHQLLKAYPSINHIIIIGNKIKFDFLDLPQKVSYLPPFDMESPQTFIEEFNQLIEEVEKVQG